MKLEYIVCIAVTITLAGSALSSQARDEQGEALFAAARQGHLDKINALLNEGIDVNKSNPAGATTLHVAAGAGQQEVCSFLLDKGADVNAKNKSRQTPIDIAMGQGHMDITSVLLDNGAEASFLTKMRVKMGHQEKSPADLSLLTAAQNGDQQKVEVLLDQGADINAKDDQGMTPLHLAAQGGHKEVVELLLSKDADINAQNIKGYTPLYSAIWKNDPNMVGLLVSKGANVNIADKQGRTPLHYAAAMGNKEIVSLLLTHGAAIDAKDDSGRTVLHYAVGATVPEVAMGHNPEVVQLLLDKDVDVNVQDAYGMAPLHIAATLGRIDIVKLLIAQGACLDMKDNAGRAPIHYAAEAAYKASYPQKWSVDMVNLLIDAGVDINIKDNIGWTPLHYAAYGFKKYLVEVLLERGADIDVVDNRGRTPHVLMCERALWLETLRGPDFESILNRAAKRGVRDISRLLHKDGCVFVVAPNGKDTNPGTRESPLRTITAAIEVVRPGDIILVRGGTYVCSRTIHIDRSGEQGNPLRLAAYPGEVPTLDFSAVKGNSVFISGAYWHIKGFTVTRAMRPLWIHGSGAHHNILEQVRASGNYYGGIIISSDGPAHNIILNCDSCRNFDPQSDGENSDGFSLSWDLGQGNTLIGNRSWNNSDDGYDCWKAGNAVRFERCYAWGNGENIWNHPLFVGNGNGFKLGNEEGRHILVGCLSWGHHLSGCTLNGNTSGVIVRNCTFWNNDTNYALEWSGWPEDARKKCVIENSISYHGRRKDWINRDASTQGNSWDSELGLTFSDDDFIGLDDRMMSGRRNPDGSIPYNNFLRLAPGSAAIDKGADVGMPFVGARPDLGAFEYDPNETSEGYVKMLHQAVRDHDVKEVNKLLVAGEGINDKDWLGYTPLHWAVYFGYSDLVELLISKGADPDIQSDTGRYAIEIARAMAYPELEALLRKLGAKE